MFDTVHILDHRGDLNFSVSVTLFQLFALFRVKFYVHCLFVFAFQVMIQVVCVAVALLFFPQLLIRAYDKKGKRFCAQFGRWRLCCSRKKLSI